MRAAQLRARYCLRPADAFQVATALVHGAMAFVTNDWRLTRLAPVLDIIILDDFASVSHNLQVQRHPHTKTPVLAEPDTGVRGDGIPQIEPRFSWRKSSGRPLNESYIRETRVKTVQRVTTHFAQLG